MANFIVCMYIFTIMLISQYKTAVESASLKPTTTLYIKDDNSASTLHSQSHCSNLQQGPIGCWQGELTIIEGDCATYNDEKEVLSAAKCPFYHQKVYSYNYTVSGSILLPENLSQINDYMCSPLKRKGFLCGECTDGFGPSVTSFKTKCVNCTNAWYGVPLFLFLEFVPVTVLYLVIVVFQISITSPPMPCLILCTQFIIFAFDKLAFLDEKTSQIMTNNSDLRLDMKIVLSLYRVLNLDLVQIFLAPLCLSSKLKFIHITFFGYVSAFYPFLLIFLTWICVELHGHNIRPLVWLWRPFHRCFVRLRRGWDTKSDITDAFITFFFLTYCKIFYQTILMTSSRHVRNIELSGKYFMTYVCSVDNSVEYGSIHHILVAIPVMFVSLLFNILPSLLLVLYPFRFFRSCLSKHHLNFTIMHIFMDKIYRCYRNGLDGGRDMRSFSGLYFIMGFISYFAVVIIHASQRYIYINQWSTIGTMFFITTLAVTIAKPYQKAYMNYTDVLLLSNYIILCYTLSSGVHTQLIS